MPMSNPTHLAEAVPEDLFKWTDGKALIATGSPFETVEYNGVSHEIGQSNNAFVFPGLGLGSIVAKAQIITNGMFAASANAVAKWWILKSREQVFFRKSTSFKTFPFKWRLTL